MIFFVTLRVYNPSYSVAFPLDDIVRVVSVIVPLSGVVPFICYFRSGFLLKKFNCCIQLSRI